MIFKGLIIILLSGLVVGNELLDPISGLLNPITDLLSSIVGSIIGPAILDPILDIKLTYYWGRGPSDYRDYDSSDATSILRHPRYIHRQTHILIVVNLLDADIINIIIRAYAVRNNINLIIINLVNIRAPLNAIVGLLQAVTDLLVKVILSLFDSGLDRSTLTLVGHGIGSQIAGLIGRGIIRSTNGEVILVRISAIDPLLISLPLGLLGLQSGDARFVDTIRTDLSAITGVLPLIGNVDFFPNGGGQSQPGCNSALCSGRRGLEYWAESIERRGEPGFLAIPAPNYIRFLIIIITIGPWRDDAIPMGIDCPTHARGRYYLRTNGRAPYGRGLSF